MNVVYDNSFEGLLTAIFEVFEYKLKDPVLLSENNFVNESLFSGTHYVLTSEGKSQRVFNKIKENLGNEGASALLKIYLSERKDAGNLLLSLVRNSIQYPKENVLKNYGNDDIMEIAIILKKVRREAHRMKAFVRFEKLKDGFFFAKIAPDFNVLPLIVRHFAMRYKDQKWMIYDERRGYGIWYDLEQTSFFHPDDDFIQNSKKEDEFYAEDEAQFQKLWKHYFAKTNIQERKNPKKHLQDLPRRYWKYLTEKK